MSDVETVDTSSAVSAKVLRRCYLLLLFFAVAALHFLNLVLHKQHCLGKLHRYVGGDRCRELIERSGCKSNFAVFDATCLPFRDNSFDAVVSIACLHHLSTESRRIRALTEMTRVVRDGGLIYVTVWRNDDDDGCDRFVSWNLQNCYVDEDETRYSMEARQMLSESSNESSSSSRVLKRFCHLFGRSELRSLVSRVQFGKKRVQVLSEVIDKRNVYLSCRVVSK
jgi:ubiquinone/menaquinone biosynthesis C-methylase UbiE